MALLIEGATIIDGASAKPIEGCSILIEGDRIVSIAPSRHFSGWTPCSKIDARGKFAIPGLMNANIHLLSDISVPTIARYLDDLEGLVVEAAQVALKNGLTAVFDTWGPLAPLTATREKILTNTIQGSRIFCCGNIVGFDGPYSADFQEKVRGAVSQPFIDSVNALWTYGVGRALTWLPTEQVVSAISTYAELLPDFINYAANDRTGKDNAAHFVFSSAVQDAIVEFAHGRALSVQAHTISVEGVKAALNSGCDLLQRANITGPQDLPDAVIEKLVAGHVSAGVYPVPAARLEWFMKNHSFRSPQVWQTMDRNLNRLANAGVSFLLSTDGALRAPHSRTEVRAAIGEDWDESIFSLGTGHFNWLEAMEEKGVRPMHILQAATKNVASAYLLDHELGTLEPGKLADLVLLNKNPLEAASNYRSIHSVVKAGVIVDREALPNRRILTAEVGMINAGDLAKACEFERCADLTLRNGHRREIARI